MKYMGTIFLVFFLSACTTFSDQKANNSSAGMDSLANEDDNFLENDSDSYAAGSTLVSSLGQNKYSSPKISLTKINENIDRLASKQRPTIKDLEHLIALQSLARAPFWEIWTNVQKLSRLIQGNKGISDTVKLDVGIAALKAGRYSIAEYFLGLLVIEAKLARIRASAANAVGLMYILEGNHQEAAIYFRKSLSSFSSYMPAVLNLGFLQLKFGNFAAARRTLGIVPSDWFTNTGMIIIERHLGNISRANSLCSSVLKKKPNHKISKVNCAIIEFKENKNYKRARKLLQEAAKIHGGGEVWENMIYRLLEEIDTKEFNKQLQATASNMRERKT